MFFNNKKINFKIPVEVSARHIHLGQKDMEILFGRGHQLKKIKQLSQPAEFACEELLTLQINGKEIKNVRVIGPLRDATQVEISITDAFYFSVNPPVRLSGDIEGSPGAVLAGPEGQVNLAEGVVIAQRHLHCSLEEAKRLGLKNGDKVSIKVDSERPVVFENIAVRAKDSYSLALHLDTDEGNAAGIKKQGEGLII